MLIDVKKQKQSGKIVENYDFNEVIPELELPYPDAYIDGNVHVNLDAELHGDLVYLDGTIDCTVVGVCARCLGKAVYKFGEEFSADYNAFNPKEDEYGFSRGIVDASLAVKDAIITDFPTQILCKPDCKGLCPKCGANLNVESCKGEI